MLLVDGKPSKIYQKLNNFCNIFETPYSIVHGFDKKKSSIYFTFSRRFANVSISILFFVLFRSAMIDGLTPHTTYLVCVNIVHSDSGNIFEENGFDEKEKCHKVSLFASKVRFLLLAYWLHFLLLA